MWVEESTEGVGIGQGWGTGVQMVTRPEVRGQWSLASGQYIHAMMGTVREG